MSSRGKTEDFPKFRALIRAILSTVLLTGFEKLLAVDSKLTAMNIQDIVFFLQGRTVLQRHALRTLPRNCWGEDFGGDRYPIPKPLWLHSFRCIIQVR
jgi:hypothetical protein